MLVLCLYLRIHISTVALSSSITSTPSTVVAGVTVTLNCSVTLPSGVTDTPVFQWEGPGVTPTPADPTTSGQMVSSVLTLSQIKTSQAGQYTCTATLSGSVFSGSVSGSEIVTVQSEFEHRKLLCSG